jgi:hypothetical protein
MNACLPSWVVMWLLAAAVFAGCKWLTWRQCRKEAGLHQGAWALAYLMAWPGMDPRAFLGSASASNPPPREWIWAGLKTLLGAGLFWGVARHATACGELLTGWIGLVGLALLIHFGIFHLLSLAWRRIGIEAHPLMQAPLGATSLGDFWGRRWNSAFRDLAHAMLFRPLQRHAGVRLAALCVFLVSGLVHDLVISVPAKGGYGWPTAYFAIQGAGALMERSALGKTLGLGRNLFGRAFTLSVVVLPAFWLFHPPFIRHVAIPMMRAWGAL